MSILLPCNLDAERFILGSILLDEDQFPLVAGALTDEDFHSEAHRRIFRAMLELHKVGGQIDRLTVAEALHKAKSLDFCGGLSFLVFLDDGLPQIPSLDSYVRIVKDKSILRRAILAAQKLIKRCLSAEENAVEILASAERAIANLQEGAQERLGWISIGDVPKHTPGGINAILAPSPGQKGPTLPWREMTRKLDGLHQGELVVVAGRPSMGKSIVGMQLAHHISSKGFGGAAVFSLEMTKESLFRRIVAGIAGVDADRIRTGRLNEEERRKAMQGYRELESIPLFVDESRARTLPAMASALRRLQSVYAPLSLVVIDHLQLVSGIGKKENRREEISSITHGVKHLAGDMGLTAVLLSQLSRECEKEQRRPQLSDLKESGTIEEDADVVVFVHRPEQYRKKEPELRGKAEFIVAKQRDGSVGTVHMQFQHSFQRFVEPILEVGGGVSYTSGTAVGAC